MALPCSRVKALLQHPTDLRGLLGTITVPPALKEELRCKNGHLRQELPSALTLKSDPDMEKDYEHA